MKGIKTHPVKSSNVAAVGYDASSKTLRVEFKGGNSYDYKDVSEHTHKALLDADSIGSYFHQHVRGSHAFSKVEKAGG